MGNFRNFDKGGRGGFGGGRGGFGDRERPAMHEATCSECNKSCEVPFKPAPGKPVFCRDCFRKDDDSGSARFDSRGPSKFGKKEFGRSGFEDRRMFKATCSECNNVCDVPFKPTGEKPVYCSNCFAGKKGDSFDSKFDSKKSDRSGGDMLEKMNAKLERILKLLEAMGSKKDPAAKEAFKKEIVKEVAKEAVKEAPKKEAAAEKAPKAKKETVKKVKSSKKAK